MTRPCPDGAALRLAFTRTSDAPCARVIAPPSSKAAASKSPIAIGISSFWKSASQHGIHQVHLVDPHTGTVLCRLFPQDKAANARGLRRSVQPITSEPVTPPPPPARGIGPLLGRMIDRQAATGRPSLPPQGGRSDA